jgi:AcrR family transcriptional regulator
MRQSGGSLVSKRIVEILDAACRVIVRGGIDRLRVSDVAAEAGVSTALVHYYFATRADLIERAFHHADGRSDERAAADAALAADARERLERLLRFQLADDEAARSSWVFWRELWTHALFDGRLRAVVGESYAAWLAQIGSRLADAVAEDGGRAAAANVQAGAQRLAALVDGLGQQLELGLLDREGAGTLLRDATALELGRMRAARTEVVP